MKNKTLAGALALVFGSFGVHRFYLEQPGLGIIYLLFFWTGIPALVSLVDAIILLSMGQSEFDHKYNWKHLDDYYRNIESPFERRRYEEQRRRDQYFNRKRQREDWDKHQERDRSYPREESIKRSQPSSFQKPTPPPTPRPQKNPYKDSGIRKFKDYDFDGAIDDFIKALEINSEDIALHFNIACAYSITEQKEEAFYHLDQSVKYGFKDFNKLESHDALAYLRIQAEFTDFKSNGYRLPEKTDSLQKSSFKNDNLLDQLQKLAELRDKGLLTDEEFSVQKRRLLD